MKRDKYRFRRLLQIRQWWWFYYAEFNNYRSMYYENDYGRYETREEYEAAFKRYHRKAHQYANECSGRLPT